MKRVGTTAQRLKEKPYEKRVCRVEGCSSCLMPECGYDGPSVEEYVEFLDEVGVEVQVVPATANGGMPRFRSKLLPSYPGLDRDPLPGFLELAHEKGIILLARARGTGYRLLKSIHPEWMMEFLDDGRPQPEDPFWFCFNSPFRDWLPEHLMDFLDNLDLDGFNFDGMNWGSHAETPYWISCCCRYCEALFKEETGLPIPRTVDFDSMTFRQFLNWRCEKTKDFMAHVTRKVREKYPDAILDFNYYGSVYGNWTMGHPVNPLNLADAGGYVFIETTFYDGASLAAKMGRAHGSGCSIWINFTQSMPECITHTAPYAEPFSPTIQCLAAIANGTPPMLASMPCRIPLARDFARSVFGEAKKRVDYIEGETVKYAALHWSQQNRDFHRPSADPYLSAAEYFKRIRGTYEILNQSHLLVDIVFDEQLTREYLSQYRVLFLSDSACLSEVQCDAIRDFVSGGGTLFATHETSLRDELGRRRDNFQLADLFGVDYRGAAAGESVHGVIYVPHDEELSRKFGYLICYAAQEADVSLRPGDEVEVLCTKSSLRGEKPLDRFDPEGDYDSGEPGVTVHPFGKGKAVYISGDVGGGYTHNPYPPLKRFVADLVGRTRPPIEVEAPKVIEVTAATRGPNELMIHLLNNPTPYFSLSDSAENAHDVCTYFYNLEEVNPIRDIKITFNDIKPETARMPLRDIDLDITGRPPTVVVPEVKIHEVIILRT